jgi:hypothetical protein
MQVEEMDRIGGALPHQRAPGGCLHLLGHAQPALAPVPWPAAAGARVCQQLEHSQATQQACTGLKT